VVDQFRGVHTESRKPRIGERQPGRIGGIQRTSHARDEHPVEVVIADGCGDGGKRGRVELLEGTSAGRRAG
jgi:hypothetical protein